MFKLSRLGSTILLRYRLHNVALTLLNFVIDDFLERPLLFVDRRYRYFIGFRDAAGDCLLLLSSCCRRIAILLLGSICCWIILYIVEIRLCRADFVGNW